MHLIHCVHITLSPFSFNVCLVFLFSFSVDFTVLCVCVCVFCFYKYYYCYNKMPLSSPECQVYLLLRIVLSLHTINYFML